ncbi:hypothetical protein HBHAL_1694 [Halobacillus halophilus DSM 2266]|uniref:Uncharacterized protein n=2 Tax=Halobacillus halophilus TaxID=1570 RepID=I0JIU3_HALH3|nr:hypothetical protein [Halobacillus halophilus]CCG44061.1 hypothetical protein HBHAL_1694 [Halobacillus halophilus DSM 2266]
MLKSRMILKITKNFFQKLGGYHFACDLQYRKTIQESREFSEKIHFSKTDTLFEKNHLTPQST